ncbi:MAG: ATP-binding protein [Saprospiraceae bacterium]
MNLREKLTLQFSIIVVSLLLLFSAAIYYFSSQYRSEEYFSRLKDKALTTANLLVSVLEVDADLLRTIDRNSINILFEEKTIIYTLDGEEVYKSLDDLQLDISKEKFNQVLESGYLEWSENQYENVGVIYESGIEKYVIFIRAFDKFGRSKLENLRNVLASGLLIAMVIIFLAGRIFAGRAVMPIARLNREVNEITAQNLDTKVMEGPGNDEVALLAKNFNKMLGRINNAFELQRNFVSNASHELRTPLASIKSQLQVMLDKPRSQEEYIAVINSVLDDTTNIADMINSLLVLAQASEDKDRFIFSPQRIDDILFQAQEELAKDHPDYLFTFDFDTYPEDSSQLIVDGNEQLLKIVFINLLDNACKFSNDNQVEMEMIIQKKNLQLKFKDHGAGIAPSELDKIFEPFYRGSNVQQVKGHGIGLCLTKKIVELHKGKIKVESIPDQGSTFMVSLPLFYSKQ